MAFLILMGAATIFWICLAFIFWLMVINVISFCGLILYFRFCIQSVLQLLFFICVIRASAVSPLGAPVDRLSVIGCQRIGVEESLLTKIILFLWTFVIERVPVRVEGSTQESFHLIQWLSVIGRLSSTVKCSSHVSFLSL